MDDQSMETVIERFYDQAWVDFITGARVYDLADLSPNELADFTVLWKDITDLPADSPYRQPKYPKDFYQMSHEAQCELIDSFQRRTDSDAYIRAVYEQWPV